MAITDNLGKSGNIGDLNELKTEDKSSVVAAINEQNENIANIQQSFTDGCNTIAAGITSCGVATAANASPETMVDNIEKIYNDRYNAGVAHGKTQSTPVLVGKTNNGALSYSGTEATVNTGLKMPSGYNRVLISLSVADYPKYPHSIKGVSGGTLILETNTAESGIDDYYCMHALALCNLAEGSTISFTTYNSSNRNKGYRYVIWALP